LEQDVMIEGVVATDMKGADRTFEDNRTEMIGMIKARANGRVL
jgi:hypothetical protein